MANTFWIIFFIGSGYLLELLFRKIFLAKYFVNLPPLQMVSRGNWERFSGSVAQVLPDFIGLIFFFAGAYFTFTLFFWVDSPWVELVFMAVLIAISCIRLIQIISTLVFSPASEDFRVVPMQDRNALISHRLLVWTSGYIIAALMFAVVSSRLGAEVETVRLSQLFVATLLLVVAGVGVLRYREQLQDNIIAAGAVDDQEPSWGRMQFAKVWHILAVLYLAILWLLLLSDLADPDVREGGAFILSFFVVPIWMVADQLVQWVVGYAMSTLRLHQDEYDDPVEPSEEELAQREKGRALYLKVRGFARIVVVGAFIVWVANLWKIRIPFFSELAAFMLDSIIILTVALIFWQFINSWIERKIQESIPESEEDGDEVDDEWGGAASRGRAYTLLPMLRKFIGSVLLVMVTMILLSSLGVDIGPLLAGAGVIGLAIGFGAQKLVADVFSGFFYLLDDAFRVGEYLNAGSVSGTVETITLRNVMLRHHRGMLQIIPHSELGAITNFMRGGIVVKFNLDFPYDAPIDKIRKVIKKVGQKMLENEEYGKDFIRPVKSQGVREISNSVMTIRVKFTAQPGTHFVIRREAYRLITEALDAQGIHYAHRKVIVDVADLGESEAAQNNPEQVKQLAGAAAMRTIEEEEQAAAGEGQPGSNDDPMG
ncbi:MAG: mechanosensitive ion channel [Desulfofustis sp.]|nr:mechanosensitive ion channel [Desulfofustis sp.]